MNNIDKIEYSICKAETGNYQDMLNELFLHITTAQNILRFILFCDVDGNDDYLYKLSLFKKKVVEFLDGILPVVTLVPQKPLDSGITLEIHSFNPDENDRLEYNSYKGFSYVVVKNNIGRFLYAGGLQSTLDKKIYSQAVDVFDVLHGILNKEGFAVDSIVRQWNYIEHITSFDNEGNQHYQMFNNARSLFYSKAEWPNGYPAATGIGTFGGGVIVDVDAVMPENSSISIVPIDNKLQIAAHSYSGSVLERDINGKTTPKFERAKSIGIDGNRMVYISGTAAIRGEESLHGVGVINQLEVTLENIRQLTGGSKVKLFRVYLKDEEFYEKVHGMLDAEKNLQVSYLLSDVCRDELLIEIEGIAFEIEN